ncbi:MAG: class I SAM-dependent methyltransferase [Anaerolineales bacterium]|nr:class I SAM-dependent methyltransferase [Anaerolineales bacterium]
MTAYSFTRYLSAKKSVDDRALNQQVWQTFASALPPEPRILEVGAGIGTMVERLLERNVLKGGWYTGVDNQAENIQTARQRLQTVPAGLSLTWETADFYAFAARIHDQPFWDVIIAHAFLDLVNINHALPILFGLLGPGGLFYFSLNFDGATILQPTIDPAFDTLVETLYHQTMDERYIRGEVSGDSQTGRHLFHKLKAAGAEILAAGSSDWVVFADDNGRYPHDEAFFLHFIIQTMQQALNDHPALDSSLFNAWIAQRHAQIEVGSLVYIAHQLDFMGKVNDRSSAASIISPK